MSPDELYLWENLPYAITETARDIALPPRRIKMAAAGMYTSVPVGLWYSPIDKAYAMEARGQETPQDIQLAKAAIDAVGDFADLAPSYEDGYIKVAATPTIKSANASARQVAMLQNQHIVDNPYTPEVLPSGVDRHPGGSSPTLESVGEYLQFLPQQRSYDFIPGYGPVNGMLAGGLVGAGLGYGTGWLAEKLLPEKWKKKRLRRTLGILGGAVGAAPGAILAMTNLGRGKPLWNNDFLSDSIKQGSDQLSDDYKISGQVGSSLLWDARREAFMSAFDMEGVKVAEEKIASFDVNVDEMGRTLWQVGADPRTAATTMGTLYAAQQMPTPDRRPGFVTPSQMANLGVHMGAGYVSGGLVGAALGALTGADAGTKDHLKRTGMYLGIVRAVVPKLFG